MINVLIAFVLALALFGYPLYLVIGSVALLLSVKLGLNPALFFTQGYEQLASSPTLVSIPLFTFTGYLMAESRTGDRLVRLFESMLGWMPGGLTIQIVVVCSFFTIFTGASGVTIIALGTLLYPVLLKSNYPEDYSLGLLTASGSLGLLLPPSLPIILYGVIAKTDIRALFWAGIFPGILMMVVLGIHGIFVSTKAKTNRPPFSLQELGKALWEAKWEAALPVVVMILLISGLVGIPEIAILVTAYVFIIEVFIYKDLHLWRDIPRVCRLSLKLVGSIIIILMSALALSDILIREEIPDALFNFLKPYITNKWVFLLVLNFFLLIVGCLLDIFSAIMVVVPLIVPLANKFGVHPVHLGIIFLANLELGYLTPPVGINLFISSLTFKKPVLTLYRVSLPFLGILAIALAIITYVPSMSLWLPETTGALKNSKPLLKPLDPSKKIDLKSIKLPDDDEEDDEDDEDDGDKKDKKKGKAPAKRKDAKAPARRGDAKAPAKRADGRKAPPKRRTDKASDDDDDEEP